MPFWKNPESMQRAVQQANEEVLDAIWDRADAQLRALELSTVQLKELKAVFELGCYAATAPSIGTPAAELYGVDTGAAYIALFLGTEEEVATRLRACGVAL